MKGLTRSHDLAELSDAEVMQQLAIVKAVKKMALDAYDDLRAEAGKRLHKVHETYGANSFDVRIGDVKVGKVSFRKPTVQPSILGDYDEWAWDTNRGTRTLEIDLTDPGIPDEAIEKIRDIADEHGATSFMAFKAFPELTRSLRVENDVVLDPNGEVVPGVSIKRSTIPTVYQCTPEKVRDALIATGRDMSIAGFLEE